MWSRWRLTSIKDLLEVKKVSQIVTVSDTKKSMILLLDITLPLYELVAWIAVKLGIDDVDLANYSLYYNGKGMLDNTTNQVLIWYRIKFGTIHNCAV